MATKAQIKASRKYDDKTYKKYQVRLRKNEDKELIEFIEKNKDNHGMSNVFRTALEFFLENQK